MKTIKELAIISNNEFDDFGNNIVFIYDGSKCVGKSILPKGMVAGYEESKSKPKKTEESYQLKQQVDATKSLNTNLKRIADKLDKLI